jgi:hypothetical protein
VWTVIIAERVRQCRISLHSYTNYGYSHVLRETCASCRSGITDVFHMEGRDCDATDSLCELYRQLVITCGRQMYQVNVYLCFLYGYITTNRDYVILYIMSKGQDKSSYVILFYVKGFPQNILLLFVLIIHILLIVIPTLNLSSNHAGMFLVRYGLLTQFLGAQECLQPI